jgi:biopolymer transport protein ExbB
MDPNSSASFAGFIAQADAVTRTLLVILVVMSLATWYLIATKAIQIVLTRGRATRFLQAFWAAPSLQAVARRLAERRPDEVFSQLTERALAAANHHELHGADRLDLAGNGSEFLMRSMRRVIDEETARLESGLTTLASIGSTAPFVGLFGTVWGVYHALTAIGLSGQGTLDKVAGPVGEALLMTAAGLAVAIPAVLAYNAIVRSNRLVLARLDSFAHDLFAFLTTGSHVPDVPPAIVSKPLAAVT